MKARKLNSADEAVFPYVLFIFILLAITVAGAVGQTVDTKKGWRDKSPHKEGFQSVNNVKLHYLDWGGRGGTLLFLTGFGNSAHIYDELAPHFTDKFRVLALTRRGHGESEKPPGGYDTPNLTEDVRRFLDALSVKKASLVGHSMAGKELALFAALYPERVEKLVFLDSANDYLNVFELFKDAPDETPPQSALESFDAFRAYFKTTKCGWNEAWEADMRKTVIFADTAEAKPLKAVMPNEIAAKIRAGIEASNPDYTKIKAPALSFYALGPFPECSLPPGLSDEKRPAAEKFLSALAAHLRGGMTRFKREMPGARIVEMRNTDHFFFIQDEAQVVREMRRFLLAD